MLLKNVSLRSLGVLSVVLMDRGLYIKLIIMSLLVLPPQSLSSIFFFFTSLVLSVRNPITVIKSADPQRALLQTAGEGGRHGHEEIWEEGERWAEGGFRGRRWERRRDEAVDERSTTTVFHNVGG